MMLDMFHDLPIRLAHLIGLFFTRIAILIPLLALITWFLKGLGVFDGL